MQSVRWMRYPCSTSLYLILYFLNWWYTNNLSLWLIDLVQSNTGKLTEHSSLSMKQLSSVLNCSFWLQGMSSLHTYTTVYSWLRLNKYGNQTKQHETEIFQPAIHFLSTFSSTSTLFSFFSFILRCFLGLFWFGFRFRLLLSIHTLLRVGPNHAPGHKVEHDSANGASGSSIKLATTFADIRFEDHEFQSWIVNEQRRKGWETSVRSLFFFSCMESSYLQRALRTWLGKKPRQRQQEGTSSIRQREKAARGQTQECWQSNSMNE